MKAEVEESAAPSGAKRSGTASYEYASTHWEQLCRDHEQEFPHIRKCAIGTFNVEQDGPPYYVPPLDGEFRALAKRRGHGNPMRFQAGNHVSPPAWVVAINDIPLSAWIYRGGHGDSVLELIAAQKLAELLDLRDGDRVSLELQEFWTPASGMPGPPVLHHGNVAEAEPRPTT